MRFSASRTQSSTNGLPLSSRYAPCANTHQSVSRSFSLVAHTGSSRSHNARHPRVALPSSRAPLRVRVGVVGETFRHAPRRDSSSPDANPPRTSQRCPKSDPSAPPEHRRIVRSWRSSRSLVAESTLPRARPTRTPFERPLSRVPRALSRACTAERTIRRSLSRCVRSRGSRTIRRARASLDATRRRGNPRPRRHPPPLPGVFPFFTRVAHSLFLVHSTHIKPFAR